MDVRELTCLLAEAGFVAADEEAAELLARAGADDDLLRTMVGRRLTGEPLAWITGSTTFCGLSVALRSGVYVPRWQSELVAWRAVARLPANGVAIDVCTGSGAVARVLTHRHPGAHVVASDIDPAAVACAISNGIDAYCGDLLDPIPPGLRAAVDVVVAIPPYVPTEALGLLQRDTLTFEKVQAYDGGPTGTTLLARIVQACPALLRPGGALILELGGDQASMLLPTLRCHGFTSVDVLHDEDGDVRGIEATLDR